MARGLALTGFLSLLAHGAIAAVLARGGTARPLPSEPALPAFAGETFELPAPESAGLDPLAGEEAAPPAADAPPASAPASEDAERPKASSQRASRPAPRPAHAGTRDGDGESGDAHGPPAVFGAASDRSATDLGAAFARGFTQTASADPAWLKLPLGPAGSAVVALTIDASGHITDVRVSGAPSSALSSSIERTMALIKSRPFVARSETTTVRLSAKITAGPGTDGLDDGRYGISVRGSSASFVLPIGRRIELTVQ